MPMTHESFAAALALIGLVILVSSLLSGVVERTGIPQVAIFLLLGAVLGPAGLELVDLSLDSRALEVIATLGLVLVLFSDAIGAGHRRGARAAPPGGAHPGARRPCSPPALIALAAWLLLGLPVRRGRHPRRRAGRDRPGAAPDPGAALRPPAGSPAGDSGSRAG